MVTRVHLGDEDEANEVKRMQFEDDTQLAASDFASMTTTQLHAKVKAGEVDLGNRQNVLCSDGYYCNPNVS